MHSQNFQYFELIHLGYGCDLASVREDSVYEGCVSGPRADTSICQDSYSPPSASASIVKSFQSAIQGKSDLFIILAVFSGKW